MSQADFNRSIRIDTLYPWGERVIAREAELSAFTIKSESLSRPFKRLSANVGTHKMVKYAVIEANLPV